MSKEEWTKQKNYRLPQSTLENLDYLVDLGLVRNATEGIIVAVERMTTEERTKRKLNEQ